MVTNASLTQRPDQQVPAWQHVRLGDVATIAAGGTPSRSIAAYWNGNVPWVTTSEIDFNTINSAAQSITELGLQNSAAKILQPGTLVMALYGQGKTRGKVGLLGIQAATNQACASITLRHGIDPLYVFYSLAYRYEFIRSLSNTGNQDNLNGGLVRSISIPVPPLPEQQAIAKAVSDVDDLIQSLERLIAKKRDLKQAAMQQLLTGQTRLPGFEKQWQQRPLAALAEVSKGEQIAKGSATAAGTVAYFNGGVAPSGYTHAPNTPANTIAVSEGGNSCGYVNFVTQPFWCGGHCYSIVPRTGLDKRFLYQALKGQQVALMGLRVGSGLPNIQKSVLSAFVLRIPTDEDEQVAIAEVLSDMDAEIAALEARLAKTRDLKQGMMQELLTGRTRLV